MALDLDVQLSPHFTLREMVRTNHRYFNNEPDAKITARLRQLCVEFLEPVRKQFGPLWITSGYRRSGLNAAVGGSKSSAHLFGCAADFVPLRRTSTAVIVAWVVGSDLPYDQLIDEYSSTSNWIHLGMLRPGHDTPRCEALTMRRGRYTQFVDPSRDVAG